MLDHRDWVSANAGYAGEIAKSAWSGASRGWERRRTEHRADVAVTEETVVPLASAAIGLVAGVASALAASPRHRTRNAVVAGLAGGALGFAGAVAWSFRRALGGAAQGAAREVEQTRNLHWLEQNPIDYA